MQNRSFAPIVPDEKIFPSDFPVLCMEYTQHYRAQHTLHTHSCIEIGLCLKGSGGLFIGGEIFPFEAGSVQMIQRGCVHDSHILMSRPDEPPSQWRYIFADLEALGIWQAQPGSFTVKSDALSALYDLLYRELSQRPPDWQGQVRRLLEAFLLEAGRCAPPRTQPLPDTAHAQAMAAVLHFIAVEYASDLSVEKLARRCNMSVSFFRKVFTRHVGMGPQQYILHVRLSLAAHMLRQTQKPILTISGEVGFGSLSSFNRLFRKAYGCTPREWRLGTAAPLLSSPFLNERNLEKVAELA